MSVTLQAHENLGPHELYLASTPDTVVWGWLPCETDAFVASVRPGQSFIVDTVSHEGILADQGRDPRRFFGRHGVAAEHVLDDAVEIAESPLPHNPDIDGPHIVTGPIEVAGARPGDLLEIEVLDLARRTDYGIISNRHGCGALPDQMPLGGRTTCTFASVESGRGVINVPGQTGRSLRFNLRPFLGLTGVAVAGSRRPHSVPPGRHGGNLDVSCLGMGSRLYLCVQVPGAGLCLGDPHFAQGDGEVALTAFEAPLRATLRVQLIEATSLPEEVVRAAPFGETPEALIPIGLSEDLNEAMRECVRHALVLLEHRYALDLPTAYAYLSAATDFSVSQVVDVVKGVHACIKRTDLTELNDRWHTI
jgi:acetamidase/formamidase